jgi:WD40 repeat protein
MKKNKPKYNNHNTISIKDHSTRFLPSIFASLTFALLTTMYWLVAENAASLNPANFVLTKTLEEQSEFTDQVTFSPNGKWLASCSGEGKVRIWDASEFNLKLTLDLGKLESQAICFSPDSQQLACGGSSVTLWNPKTGTLLRRFKRLPIENDQQNYINAIQFSPDGKTIATGVYNTIYLWDVATGHQLNKWKAHLSHIDALDYSPDGTILASAGSDYHEIDDRGSIYSGDSTSFIYFWNPENGKKLNKLVGHKEEILSLSFSPNGKMLASASWDESVKIWNTKSGKVLRNIKKPRGYESVVEFAPNGSYIVAGGMDIEPNSIETLVRIYDVTNGNIIQSIIGNKVENRTISFSPDGKKFASGGCDDGIKIYGAP